MNSRKWRNPYAPINKKVEQVAKTNGQTAAPAPLSLTSRPTFAPLDIRTSVSKMRTNIKGISTTIRQMEQTMDTLYGAMEMLDSLGRPTTPKDLPVTQLKGSARRQPEADTTEGYPGADAGDGSSNPLGNLDINQILGLLQSPLVQSLLSQNNGAATKRKKEG